MVYRSKFNPLEIEDKINIPLVFNMQKGHAIHLNKYFKRL